LNIARQSRDEKARENGGTVFVSETSNHLPSVPFIGTEVKLSKSGKMVTGTTFLTAPVRQKIVP
jgi:hypothetical protein